MLSDKDIEREQARAEADWGLGGCGWESKDLPELVKISQSAQSQGGDVSGMDTDLDRQGK